uniref:Uncharacterized protein n=1 Tax=Glossina palpalis gambiensis TaxID=67801 RepID=A0A1B0BJS4_9MUSC
MAVGLAHGKVDIKKTFYNQSTRMRHQFESNAISKLNYILLGIICMPAVLTSNVTATTLLLIVMLFRTNDEKHFLDDSTNELTGLEVINSVIKIYVRRSKDC